MVDYDERHLRLVNEMNTILRELKDMEKSYLEKHVDKNCDFETRHKFIENLYGEREWLDLMSHYMKKWESFVRFYKEYLIKECQNLTYKKDKIIALELAFGGSRVYEFRNLMVEAVGCTRRYASRFMWSSGAPPNPNSANMVGINDFGCVYDMRYYLEKKHRELRPGIDVEKRVFKRDGYKCVRCCSEQDIEIHHIIPVCNPISTSKMENLASLCRGCHLKAHLGDFASLGRDYDLAYSSQHEFWEKWVRGEKTRATGYHEIGE